MASLSGAAARSAAAAGGAATAMQRCFMPRLPHRGITAPATSSASGPLRKATQRSDSSERSPVVLASSNKDSQAASDAGPAPAVRAAQQAPFWRLAARPLLLLFACWLLLLLTQTTWSADAAVRLAQLAGASVATFYAYKRFDMDALQYFKLLCRKPATPTAELARKFRLLKLDAESKVLFILGLGSAFTAVLLVADVLSSALLGEGLADYLLQAELTRSSLERPMPQWAMPPLLFLPLAVKAAREATDAFRTRRLFWAAAAARRQANAARLSAKRSGARQPSMQP